MIDFTCDNCGRRIRVGPESAGRKGRCPQCKSVVTVPMPDDGIPPSMLEAMATGERVSPTARSSHDTSSQPATSYPPDRAETPPQRPFPAAVDIFLYPQSISGMVNLLIFWLLPPIIGFIMQFVPVPFVGAFLQIIVAGYMYYYILDCVRDSAIGGIRAPENLASQPDMGDALDAFRQVIASLVVFWGPLAAYLLWVWWRSLSSPQQAMDVWQSPVFWAALAYGVFFFAIDVLALAMFDSASAFNPLLWLTSIFSTFFEYIGLVLGIAAMAVLAYITVVMLAEMPLFAFFAGGAAIYMIMVIGHIIGRFYYRNSRKLRWEV